MIATHVSIAPRAPSFLAGRGGAARIGHESHDPIEANLLLLPCADERAIAIVALDALFGSLELRQVILDALGDARPRLAELVLVASHSHSTPTLDPVKPGLGRCQLDHLSAVGTDIALSIRQLLQASAVPPRQPEAVGSLWHGRAACSLNVVRRRRALRILTRSPFITFGTELLPNRQVETPHDIDLWLCRDGSGQVQWVVWSWPCHATSFFHDTLISADFPGAVRTALRLKLGRDDLPVLYFPGFCGDIRADSARSPIGWRRRLATPFARPFAEHTAPGYADFCRGVSAAVLDALAGVRPAGSLRRDAVVRRGAVPFDAIMRTPNSGSVGLARLDCGDLCALFMGAETCSPYYPLLAPCLPQRALLTGYADMVPLYLPSDQQVGEGGYEVDGFRGSFGLPGTFHPEVQRHFVDAVQSLSRGDGPMAPQAGAA